MCWLLFLFIFPYTKVTVGTKEQLLTSKTHSFLAFCVLAALIINCFLIVNLYDEFFDQDALAPLSGIGYAIVAAAGFAVVVMIINNFSSDSAFKYTHSMVALCEMACLVLFGVFMIMFTQYPPIPSDQLSCVMIPFPSPSPSASFYSYTYSFCFSFIVIFAIPSLITLSNSSSTSVLLLYTVDLPFPL